MRSIVPYDHPALHSVAEPVTEFDDWLRDLAADMDRLRAGHGGVGIAAPQVGVSLRLFVIDDRLPDGSRSDRYGSREIAPLTIANPVITSRSNELEDGEEGCLSLPETLGADGERRIVPRPASIAYQGLDLNGRTIAGHLVGFMARVFCHEADHLDGLLIDRYPVAETERIG